MSIVSCIKRAVKLGKKIKHMAKNRRKSGKSARNGNAPSPYTKYNKAPYRYSFNTKKVVNLDDERDKQKEDFAKKKKRKVAA